MVSIIIPAYNYGSFISETLESVMSQSYRNFECIIIDNGSSDNTKEVVQPFLSDPRFRYFYRENNGVAVARNFGLQLARGSYIQFLDADDLIEKNKLATAVQFLEENSDSDIVYSDMRYFQNETPSELFRAYNCNSADDKAWMSYVNGRGKDVVNVFLQGNTIVISSPVFRKALIDEVGGFDQSIQHNEDWDFWLRLALANKQYNFVDAPDSKTLIRLHKKSASVNIFKMQVCGFIVLEKNSTSVNTFGLTGLLNERKRQHVEWIRDGLIKTRDKKLFEERLSYLKQKGIYHLFFKSDVKNSFWSRQILRFKKITIE